MIFSKNGLRVAATVGALAVAALGLGAVHSPESAALGAPPSAVLPTDELVSPACGPFDQATRVVFTVPSGSGTFTASTTLPDGRYAGVPAYQPSTSTPTATATIVQDRTAKTFRVTGATFDSKRAYVVDVIGYNGSQFPKWETWPGGVGGTTELLDVSALGNFTTFSLCLWPGDVTVTLTSTVDSGVGVFGYHFTCRAYGEPLPVFATFDFDVPTSSATPGVVKLDIPLGSFCEVHTTSVPPGYVSDSDKKLAAYDSRFGTRANDLVMHNKKGTFDLEVKTTANTRTVGVMVHYDFTVTVTNRGTADFVATDRSDEPTTPTTPWLPVWLAHFASFDVHITHPVGLLFPESIYPPADPSFFPFVLVVGKTFLSYRDRTFQDGRTWRIPSIAAGETYTLTSGEGKFDMSPIYVPRNTDVCATIPTSGFLLQPVESNTANNTSCVSVLP